MTPAERAGQLVAKYCKYSRGDAEYSPKQSAKQCALIAVDELIQIAQDDIHFKHTEYAETHPNYKSYWRLVKEEINKV